MTTGQDGGGGNESKEEEEEEMREWRVRVGLRT